MPASTKLALRTLCAFAALAFLRYYTSVTHMWLNLPAYLTGHERLPFQLRVLPIPFLLGFNKIAEHLPFLSHGKAVLTPDKFSFFCLSSIAFAITTVYLVRLYRAVSPTRLFEGLIFPVFLILCLWTYTVHVGDVLSYPYDLPAVAFFTAGIFYIYQRRFWPLLAVVTIGTFNRETTLFLIGIYLIDSASIPAALGSNLRTRLRFGKLSKVSWARAALLTAIWLTIQLTLQHRFAHNDRSEDFLRVRENLPKLMPRQWPAILNIGAYTVPAILLLRRRIHPIRLSNYLLIFPVWVAVMFCKGVLSETRIYGELTAYIAISVVLLIEDHARVAARRLATQAVETALCTQPTLLPSSASTAEAA